ncbi:MAG: phosphohydrolase [Deltaproteobacteria bacterium]|nr:MAG: phosphohydrolase [Deltaproteobacteria bacterium]
MNLKRIADLLFEVGMLQRTPRTGYRFLGTGEQSVAEHLFRTALIGYVLARIDGRADVAHVTLMCLVHDLPESRTGDQNYVYKKYVDVKEDEAIRDMFSGTPFEELGEILQEFNEAKTPEALLSHDADQIELMLQLKEQKDLGNRYAEEWLKYALKRLKTPAGRQLAEAILQREFCDWWFEGEEEDWWVKGR